MAVVGEEGGVDGGGAVAGVEGGGVVGGVPGVGDAAVDEHEVAFFGCEDGVVPVDDVEGAVGSEDVAGVEV